LPERASLALAFLRAVFFEKIRQPQETTTAAVAAVVPARREVAGVTP
jgi:hypothetical protein